MGKLCTIFLWLFKIWSKGHLFSKTGLWAWYKSISVHIHVIRWWLNFVLDFNYVLQQPSTAWLGPKFCRYCANMLWALVLLVQSSTKFGISKQIIFITFWFYYFTNIPLHCAHFCPIRINLHGKIKREITWFIQKGSANLNTTKFQTYIPLRPCRSQMSTTGQNSFWIRI